VHFAADDPWLEPLTVLAAVAAVTSRIVLSTGVLVTPLRPSVLAKTAASVDAISDGRLELGVGVGWQPEEFAAVGADFSRRGEYLTDGIRACQALWRASPASHTGTTVSFSDLWCSPRPARPLGIPVLFSGSLHARNLRRITELGTGWITHPGLPLREIAAGAALLRERFASQGRDPAVVRIRTRLPIMKTASGEIEVEATFGQLGRYRDAGVTDLTLWTKSLTRSPGQIRRLIAQVGTAWREYGFAQSGNSRPGSRRLWHASRSGLRRL
jgi:probable F420-dependent oxidoreductase